MGMLAERAASSRNGPLDAPSKFKSDNWQMDAAKTWQLNIVTGDKCGVAAVPDVTRSGIPENETLIEQTKHTHMST